MNEPHDIPDIATWVDSVQFVVNAIRQAGGQNFLLLPGSSFSSAQAFPTEAGPLLVKVTDPLGDTSKLIFDGERHTPMPVQLCCILIYGPSAQVSG